MTEKNGKTKLIQIVLIVILPLLTGGGSWLGSNTMSSYKIEQLEVKVKTVEAELKASQIGVINTKIGYMHETIKKLEKNDKEQTVLLNSINLALARLNNR